MSTNDHRQPCCKEWDELGTEIDAALVHYQISGGKPPDISFRFCPWCGAERAKQKDEAPNL